MDKPALDASYKQWFQEIKQKVQQSQLRTAVNSNIILIELYWDLGKEIVTRQTEFKWGDNFLQQLSTDLKGSFPEINGFSRRNLYTIRQWYLAFSGKFEFVPQPVAQLPWSYQRLLITKVKDIETLIQYAYAAHKNNWSRDTLEAKIKGGFHLRAGKQTTILS